MSEANENESHNLLWNQIPLSSPSPSRLPLNSIPDPFQFHQQQHASLSKANGTTPRVSNRAGKSHSEPNSAHSTPSKLHRFSNVGVGNKGGTYSRASRPISVANFEQVVRVPHFDLVENPSFWRDHNVQVLIRIRPLNNIEKVSQEYCRCLRQDSAQTLVWLGHPETRFTFDHVACETISQDKLFKVAGLPIVENCMSGYNSCIFAYGQTGSGKTYTMMGEIGHMDGKLHEDCGITPRIFEFLFKRIREEEDNRRNERLKYSCKCSFLEIYNEQITDLLEPSLTNLQLREDLKKGVYVENLSEYSVRTVDDVLRLLLQGAANRKMAATQMNSESSRSHSVFTCIIESCWEKDSMTHLRFGRLNLVDLAGSERQKSSGAEGDRLKEAANINKSLSTLGHVIMSLVDLAHGKHRHVPYRDSRLTFLLQDSLGGNSKTTIIANVSPSICSANETLSTLKFAQRAKLIQNNAKVNEDASGDVTALQQQILQLKGQLSFLLKHHKSSENFSHLAPNLEESCLSGYSERSYSSDEMNMDNIQRAAGCSSRQIMCLKGTLIGAFRREKLAELEVKRLKAEVEQINHLVHNQQEDAQHTKMMLKFPDEKMKRLELLADGLLSGDKFLLDENNALREEIQLLEARIKENPELIQLALENNRLREQLRLFQDFYEQGEREVLLAEISELRDQFLKLLEVEESSGQPYISTNEASQGSSIAKKLEEQSDMNSKLVREVEELREEFQKHMNWNQLASGSVKLVHQRIDSLDQVTASSLPEDGVMQCEDGEMMGNELVLESNDIQKELMDSRSLLDAMESEQNCLIEELEIMRHENHYLREILQNQEKVGSKCRPEPGSHDLQSNLLADRDLDLLTTEKMDTGKLVLQARLEKLSKDLNDAQNLHHQYLEDRALELSRSHEINLVQQEVEMETSKTILHLQEEIIILRSELQGRLHSVAEENARLRSRMAAKEDETKALSAEWERATLELTTFLTEGSKSLRDASSQIETITSSFPCVNVWISEHVEKAAKMCIEKEETILLLKRSLEDAQNTVLEMDQKLNALKGATIALTGVQQLDVGNNIEKIQLDAFLNDKTNTLNFCDKRFFYEEKWTTKAEKIPKSTYFELKNSDQPPMICRDNHKKDVELADENVEIELAQLGLLEVDNAINSSFQEAEKHFSVLQSDIHEAFSLHKDFIVDHLNDIQEIRRNFADLKANYGDVQIDTAGSSSTYSPKIFEGESQKQILHQIKDELVQISDRLNPMSACFCRIVNTCKSLATAESLVEAEGWATDCSTSSSGSSAESFDPEKRSKQILSIGYPYYPRKKNEQRFDIGFGEVAIFPSDHQKSEESQKLGNSLSNDEAKLLCLKKEFRATNDAFVKINALLNAYFRSKDTWDGSATGLSSHSLVSLRKNDLHLIKDDLEEVTVPEKGEMVQNDEQMMLEAESSCTLGKEFSAVDRIPQADAFFTKFEEAGATMKEADYVLNALLKANENAQQLNSMWKEAGEELMSEKAKFVEEIQQLKFSIHLRDEEDELLYEQIHRSLMEMVNLMFAIEGSLLKDMEDLCKSMYSDAIVMVKDVLNIIANFRSLLEDVSSKVMENGIILFLLNHCHLGELAQKLQTPKISSGFHALILEEASIAWNASGNTSMSCQKESILNLTKCNKEGHQTEIAIRSEEKHGPVHDDLIKKNVELKRELLRKEVLLKGLLFDFSMLQESASSRRDTEDEIERLATALNQVQLELNMKRCEFDNLLIQYKTLEGRFAETENVIAITNSDLEQIRGTSEILSEQNADLRVLLKDLYLKKSEIEQELEEERETVRDLENEILRMASSVETKLASSMKDVNDDLQRVNLEREELLNQINSLQDRLDIAHALTDEKEAIALEARQESETSKLYAEQKEEEVKILEHSVEELESTINVLEKKVYEMQEEVERHRNIRDLLEVELEALRERLLMVESLSDGSCRELSENQFSSYRKLHGGSVELHEVHNQIGVLEEEKAELAKEIKQYRDYITELVVHAEAQSSQYQRKYKNLEAMVQEVRTDSSNVISGTSMLEKTEKSSVRTRGSSSPFRCISNLVQQMNLEKDQELSTAKLRIEELEALVASRQKEVCLLNTRLASVESMTHDVIRDLLGVKLDMTNYADLISQNRLQKLVEEAQQQTHEYTAMENEVLQLRREINDLIAERERCILEVKNREADGLTAQITLEQLRERDQLLTAQNEMLKADKTNLQRKVAELDDIVKKLIGTQNVGQRNRQHISSLSRPKDNSHGKRLNHSEKRLSLS